MKVATHKVVREIVRDYLTLESECAQSEGRFGGDQWMIRVEGIEVSFLDLQGCLQHLSKRKKEAIFWNVILDKKQKDVAKIMGITTVSVGQYVQAGFEQIVNELELPPFCEVSEDFIPEED